MNRTAVTRRRVVSSAVLAATPLLAACGAAGTTGGDAPTTSAAPVKLLYWTQRAPEDRLGNGVKAALDDYMAKHPNKITLEVGEGGQALALDKIKTAIAAGTQPDLYGGLFQSPAAELFTLGAVVDLNTALKSNKDWAKTKSELLPSNLEGCSWKDKLVMMPMMLAQQVLGLNKQILLRTGVQIPATGFTWNDFVELGKKVAVPDERWLYPWGYGWSDFNSWIYSNALAPVSADRTKVLYDTAPMRETLQWLHDQATVSKIFRPGPSANGDFDTGKFVGWSANEAAGIAPVRFPNVDSGDGNGLHITHFPMGPANTRKQIITYANVYGLIALKSTDAKRVDLAAEVTGWGGRSDVQMKIAEASGHVPPNTIAAQPANLPTKIKSNPILNKIAEYGKFTYLTPNYPSWTNSMNLLQESFMRVLSGQLLPKDALAEAQPRIQAAVDEDLRRGLMQRLIKREGYGNFLFEEVPVPTPEPNQVLVRTHTSLISRGSEILARYRKEEAVRPSIMGYSVAGTIAESGAEALAAGYRPGDRVFVSAPHAEYVISEIGDEARLIKVPDSLPWSHVPFIALARGGVAWAIASDAKPEDTVVVLGQGLVGNLVMQAHRARGVGRTIAVDSLDLRARISRECGADIVVHAGQTDPVAEVKRLTDGKGADVVVDCVGGPPGLQSFQHALDMVKTYGTIHLVALYHGQPLALDSSKIQRKKLIGGYYLTEPLGPLSVRAAEHIAAGRIQVEPMITHRFPAAEAPQAFAFLDQHPEQALGILLEWPQ